MNYHNITKDDMVNGDGLRVVLWLAGCNHECKGCQNPITWDPNGGLKFTEEVKQEIFTELKKDYISGITLSGGDPLHPSNRKDVEDLILEIKEKFPNKTIWLYTGFLWENIEKTDGIKNLDVLIDGKFILEKRNINLQWRGSDNQRVINVKESLKEKHFVSHI